MPRALEREELERERDQIVGRLNQAVETEIGSALWRTRLEVISRELVKLETTSSSKASVALLFEGDAVHGTKEIRADFAAKALESFQGLVAVTFAQTAGQKMTQRGRTPLVDQSRLYIRDMARGSVGFILEEADSDQYEVFDSSLKAVVENAVTLIDHVSDPQRTEDPLRELSPRVVQSIHKFAEVLQKSHSQIKLFSDQTSVDLQESRVQLMYDLLNQINIREVVSEVSGILLGILPESGRFEFKAAPADNIISGDTSIDLQWRYIAEANFSERFVMKPVVARIKKIELERAGRIQKEDFILEDVQIADQAIGLSKGKIT